MSLIESNEVLNYELHLSRKDESSNSKMEDDSLSAFDSVSKLQSFSSNIGNDPLTRLINNSILTNGTPPITFTSKITNKILQTLKMQFQLLFPVPYPSSFFEKISSGYYHAVIAFDKTTKEIYGFCVIELFHPDKKATILAIGVMREHQNKKVGSAILKKCIEEITILGMSEIHLIVQDVNHIAKKLYYKFGFFESRTIPEYYNILEKEEEKVGIEMKMEIRKEKEKIWLKDILIQNFLCMGRRKEFLNS